ncbi:PQQ-dependent sugar dehydrogenase [Nocardioides baculatus]|uniref:PQQ-dependent sugar dehydrogenase n=1 Tax=Nocardioides baculatus TaxID=2801337 RepID=A0ABS1LD76_9ACTN|nr:PQQ-dependent sugar dehydrogenase [Nocardioides baculatus]MBL0748476.1 PQQ-dependent sugar dehydrogenase [Nocardioides baculatus]
MRSSRRATPLTLSVAALAVALLAPLPPSDAGPAAAADQARPAVAERQAPALRVRTVARGLQHPWDVQQGAGGRLIVSERDRARLSVVRNGKRRTLANLAKQVWVSGETGLLSLAVETTPPTLWACHGSSKGGNHVQVTRWRIDSRWKTLSNRKTVISGFPSTSGRHGGCRLLLDRDSDALLIGTGDAAVGTNPRNLDSLGGKVLRVHRRTGAPMADNPYADATTARRFVWTYGHRNVQGLAQRADGSLWSVEHGSYRDDEVNLLVRGGDYGWNPVPGYNEEVPMTDQSLPGTQQEAAWSSGTPTIATSGAAWVRGSQWGALEGTLAVAVLKDAEMIFLRFDDNGALVSETRPRSLTRFGRLRSVTSARNGDLLVTTDNGDGDRILRISPR